MLDPAKYSAIFNSLFPPTMASQDKAQKYVESDDPERSDPAINSDALPDDFPVQYLDDARKHYGSGQRPPFGLVKHSDVKKSVVIPTKNGLRPSDEKAVKVNILAKVCSLQSNASHPMHTLGAGSASKSYRALLKPLPT